MRQNLGHGANVVEMATKYGKVAEEIIDFSANINPHPIENLEEYVLKGLKQSAQYPDIDYTHLKQNIAAYLGCEPVEVIPGNGATEIIYLLMKSLKGTLAIFNPTFSEYERSAKLSGLKVLDLYFDKDKDFEVNLEKVKEEINHFDHLFICNPNNPTGRVQNIKPLLELLNEYGKTLIVDETFIEFTEEEQNNSLINEVKEYAGLIIIKAATKFFGLPGIRLGYGITSNKALLEQMYFYKEPWTINSFAEALAETIFQQDQYIEKSKSYFKLERETMLKALDEIQGLKAYETSTNFILIKLKNQTANDLKEVLFKNHHILIRDASNFKGLDESFIRVAIKSEEDNRHLLEALKAEVID